MNEQEIIDALRKGKEAEAPLWHGRTRRSLLLQHSRIGRFALLRTFITHLVMNKYSIPGTVLGVLALSLVLNFATMHTEKAQAEELAQRAFTRAIQISPEMRAKLEASMKADMLDTLKEARAAKDLRILTAEEYAKESNFTISTSSVALGIQGETGAAPKGTVTNVKFTAARAVALDDEEAGNITFNTSIAAPGPAGITSAGMVTASATMLTPVKYLSYTNPEGGKVVLGLDKDDTPVFKIATLVGKDMVEITSGSVSGTPGVMTKFIRAEK